MYRLLYTVILEYSRYLIEYLREGVGFRHAGHHPTLMLLKLMQTLNRQHLMIKTWCWLFCQMPFL